MQRLSPIYKESAIANLTEFKASPEKKNSFTELLGEMLPQFKLALPAHLKANAERYLRVAVTEYRRNPALQKCDPYSVLGAAMVATGLGLEVGPGGRAFLIPYGTECTLVTGWKGLVELANRSGRSSVWTGVIYDDQKHEYQQGSEPHLKVFDDSDEIDPGKIAYAYSVGRIRGSDWPVIERWSKAKILKHRDRYNKVGERHYSYKSLEMYMRKVPLLQVIKYMPYSPELEAAIVLDASAEEGRGLNVQSASDALEGVFSVEQEGGAPKAAPTVELTPAEVEEAFALADDALRSKDFKLARSHAAKLPKAKRELILERCPPEE